jgi:hypothetical protein
VRQRKVTADGADVELDHVDPELERGIERRERVALHHRVRPAVTDPLGHP